VTLGLAALAARTAFGCLWPETSFAGPEGLLPEDRRARLAVTQLYGQTFNKNGLFINNGPL
jgi:hypothetical protein